MNTPIDTDFELRQANTSTPQPRDLLEPAFGTSTIKASVGA